MTVRMTARGKLVSELANSVSAAMTNALAQGVDCDVACCVAASVAAHYGVPVYGESFIDAMAKAMRDNLPLGEVSMARGRAGEVKQ